MQLIQVSLHSYHSTYQKLELKALLSTWKLTCTRTPTIALYTHIMYTHTPTHSHTCTCTHTHILSLMHTHIPTSPITHTYKCQQVESSLPPCSWELIVMRRFSEWQVKAFKEITMLIQEVYSSHCNWHHFHMHVSMQQNCIVANNLDGQAAMATKLVCRLELGQWWDC